MFALIPSIAIAGRQLASLRKPLLLNFRTASGELTVQEIDRSM
jgi:hypothetical protein